MLDLRTRIRRHVDDAAPPVDIDALVRSLVDDAPPLPDVRVATPRSRLVRWRPFAAFAAALVVVVAAVAGVAWLLAGDPPVVGDTTPPPPTEAPTTAPPETTTEPTAPPTPATTATTPPATAPPLPAEAAEPITLDELQTAFADPALWSEELRESYVGGSLTEHDFFGLEIGTTLGFEGELLGGGSFSTDALAGRPAVIVAWYGEPDSFDPDAGWTQLHDNLSALEKVHEAFASRLGVVSIFIPYDGAFQGGEPSRATPPGGAFHEAVAEQLTRNRYTFPVVVEPATPDGRPMTAWTELGDAMPAWVLIDDSGRIVEGFVGHVAPIPVGFLLAELTEEAAAAPATESTPTEWWTTFTEADGLADDCAWGMVAAADGTLWVTGPCGVSRYDGSTWTAYQEGVDVDVTLGPDGTPWFATSHTILHFLDGTWEALAPPADWEPDAEVHGLAITADGTVWTGEGDTMLWSYDGSRWIAHPDVVPDGMAGLVAAAPDGSLWAGMASPPTANCGSSMSRRAGSSRTSAEHGRITSKASRSRTSHSPPMEACGRLRAREVRSTTTEQRGPATRSRTASPRTSSCPWRSHPTAPCGSAPSTPASPGSIREVEPPGTHPPATCRTPCGREPSRSAAPGADRDSTGSIVSAGSGHSPLALQLSHRWRNASAVRRRTARPCPRPESRADRALRP